MTTFCEIPVSTRRRHFWSTQPDACGSTQECGVDCGRPGFIFADQEAPAGDVPCNITVPEGCDDLCANDPLRQRTLSTSNYVRGLIINMLMTDGRLADTPCGHVPRGQGGHWSESFIPGNTLGAEIGTLLRTAATTGRIQTQVALMGSYASATLQRLVTRGVANAADVTAAYLGDGKVRLDIVVTARDRSEAKVGITGARAVNGWIWN